MKKPLVILLIFILSINVSAQVVQSVEKNIDKLFIDWNSPNHPGGAVGVVQDGKMIFSRAYGLASLEYLVPNSTGMRFNIASVSKQFTAMGIVRLHLKGKLSIDDDVRKHIPELPDLGQTVTIRHMLHHTSGMRSLHSMLSLAGWRSDDSRTNMDLLRFMRHQKDLNFVPGDEYMYCNTGYILMAILIEKISGEKFSTWMKKEIFSPLGLNDTYVEDLYNRVVPNNATSYSGSKKRGFIREVEYWGYTGSGNVHSTIFDLLSWYKNYYMPQEGWGDAFSMMQTIDDLNNGQLNDYAFGVRVESYRSEKRISHSGSIGGFRAYACTFPDRKLEIVVLTNFSSSAAGEKVNSITNILLNKPVEEVSRFEMKTVKIDSSAFDKYAGIYSVNEDPDRQIEFFRKEATYFCKSTGQENLKLSAADRSTFFSNSQQIRIVFYDADIITYKMVQNGREYTGSKTVKYVPTIEDFNEFAGQYWSAELHTQYTFSVKSDQLLGFHTRHGEFRLENLRKDEYLCFTSFIRKITVSRDKDGRIAGFYVTNSRVRNLYFEKRK
ncbi:serine hydrolase domain-containing protein [Acidobacteriota bacterium]